ncbi:MAG: hypothetical protein HN613_03810, partial [Gammaproteobacteria bacterium]|nr:hypothetical protein [Gammaproteobacteria bacterium]
MTKNSYEKSILSRINSTSDIRQLEADNLIQLANEVRQEMIESVAETGGHLGAGLGVVELTVVLHY